VRGLCTKTHEFYLSSLSSTSNFDIIALTETWLNDSVSDGELLDLDRFNVFRKDRNSCRHKRGGGVLLAINPAIKATVCNDCDNVCDILHSIDLLVAKLSMKFRPIFISVVYIPPSCSNTDYCAFVDFLISLACMGLTCLFWVILISLNLRPAHRVI
jgi:hypothetical protein